MECKCYCDTLRFFRSALTLSMLFLQLFSQKRYHLLDDDGGGCLSPREFHHLLLMFGWHVPVHACETLIIAMNKGKDKKAYHDDRGQVCLKENTFVAEMMS